MVAWRAPTERDAPANRAIMLFSAGLRRAKS